MSLYDQKSIIKDLQCTECKTITPIRRRQARNRKEGHVKHMYCYRCRKITAHKELV